VWVETLSDQRIRLEEGGTVRNGVANIPANYHANFEDKVYLIGGSYHVQDTEAVVILNWKYLGPDPGATLFRHVFDCAGNVLGLGDGEMLGRTLQFTYLKPGAEVRDVRHIPLDAQAADGCYYVEVGLFRPDGSRVPPRALDGKEFENAVVILH